MINPGAVGAPLNVSIAVWTAFLGIVIFVPLAFLTHRVAESRVGIVRRGEQRQPIEERSM